MSTDVSPATPAERKVDMPAQTLDRNGQRLQRTECRLRVVARGVDTTIGRMGRWMPW